MTVPAGKGSDLRDRLTFPSFSDSPGEHDLDLRYLPMLRTPRCPKRHWCFLGEIVDVVTFGRLVIHVRDVTGRELQVAMYDDNRGQKFMSTSIRGHTVAILYAKRHDFLDGGSGFKVDEEYRMTILPFSMQELLLANEKIFSPSDRKRCAEPSCKNRGDNLCSACKTVFYCSVACQKTAWAEHKKICKPALVVRWFSERDWLTFEHRQGLPGVGYWGFPKDFSASHLRRNGSA